MMVTFMPVSSGLFQPGHDLIGDGLHRRFRVSVITRDRFWLRRHGAGDTRTPFVVVAKFAFLEAMARVGNAEALLDLEQVLKLPRSERIRRLAQLRSDQ